MPLADAGLESLKNLGLDVGENSLRRANGCNGTLIAVGEYSLSSLRPPVRNHEVYS